MNKKLLLLALIVFGSYSLLKAAEGEPSIPVEGLDAEGMIADKIITFDCANKASTDATTGISFVNCVLEKVNDKTWHIIGDLYFQNSIINLAGDWNPQVTMWIAGEVRFMDGGYYCGGCKTDLISSLTLDFVIVHTASSLIIGPQVSAWYQNSYTWTFYDINSRLVLDSGYLELRDTLTLAPGTLEIAGGMSYIRAPGGATYRTVPNHIYVAFGDNSNCLYRGEFRMHGGATVRFVYTNLSFQNASDYQKTVVDVSGGTARILWTGTDDRSGFGTDRGGILYNTQSFSGLSKFRNWLPKQKLNNRTALS